MKKKYFVLLILAISIAVCYVKINAATDITSLPSGSGSNTDKYNYWTNFATSDGPKYIRGMRVTLLKTDGTQVGHSSNIIAYNEHYNILGSSDNYVVLGTGCSKVQYIMGTSGCNVYNKLTKSGDGNPWESFKGYIYTAESLSSLFSPFNVSLQSYIENWDLDRIWEWADTDKLDINDSRIVSLYSTLFGLSADDLKNIAESVNPSSNSDDALFNNLWITVEPITMLTFDGKMYLGTSYELGFLGYVNWKPVNSAMGRVLPCAALTTGDIITRYKNVPGASSTSYFNGNLNIVDLSESASYSGGVSLQNVCAKTSGGKSSDILAEQYVTGNKGAGIGLVYFKDTVKLSLTCEEVNSGISNYSSFMSKLESTYRRSGLNGIYALPEVANGIKYTVNGKTNVADKVWYINECTCYGVYDAYKNSNNIELYNLVKNQIKSVFVQKQSFFVSFVESVKEQVNKISETNPSSVGVVTQWDYIKYENLNCGFATATCESVDFNKLDEESTLGYYGCYSKCRSQEGWGNTWRFYNCLYNCTSDNEQTNEKNKIIRSCQKLPLYPSTSFTDEYLDKNKELYKQCFELYNSQFGTNWTISSYQSAGCITQDEKVDIKKKYNCTPSYNVGTCINQENVFYTDTSQELNEEDYWKYCVFSDENAMYTINEHKWSDKNQPLTYYDENITSDYCEVYCIENLTGAFNSNTIKVKAGQHFVWNGHSVSGSRTCKTKSIEWNKFTTDLKNKNNEIEKAFNTYLVARDQQASVKQYTVKNGCSECVSWYPTHPCADGKGTCGGGCRRHRYWDETCIKWDSATYGSGATYAHGSAGSACSCSGYPSDDRFGRDSKYQTWDNMKDDAKYIYDQMKKCYNEDNGATWISSMSTADGEGSSWDQWLYIVEPSAIVKYNYTINGSTGLYSVNEEMDKKIEYTEKVNKNDCQTVSGGIEVLTSCNTSTNKCTRQMLGIKKCTKVEMTKGANIDFNIPAGIYEYINKDDNISFNASQLETLKSQYISQGKTFNYIYLGYSNFPVEYKTPDGIYGQEYGNGELSITYSNLGYKVPNKSTAVDSILDAIDKEKYGNWQCQFEVFSELIPEDDPDNPNDPDNPDNPNDPNNPNKGDINLIYRPIDLYDPFPDIDASGRETGSNWCYGLGDRTNCSNTNPVVDEFILNNRDVEGHEIYSEEPMYTFILTPSIIKEIRNYNDENSYAEYYGSYSGKTYDFKCNTGTGKTCISDYLSYLIDITGAKNQPGVCVDDRYRSYNDPNNFDNCRY